MLHLIIPPIIIIASAVLLLLFISRKVSILSEEDNKKLESESRGEITRKIRKFGFSKVSKLSLNFLEIATQRFKIIFLKSYNVFDGWLHSIKKRKERDLGTGQKRADKRVFRRIIPQKGKIRKNLFFGKSSKSRTINEGRGEEIMKKESRPMISREITQPEFLPVIKNKFEEILIKRIATNPRDLEAYERLGDYYIEQGNVEDALECYRQVLKLNPVNYKAKIKTKKLEKISSH